MKDFSSGQPFPRLLAATLAVVFHVIKQPTILNEEINNINKVVNNYTQANSKDIIHQATAGSVSFD